MFKNPFSYDGRIRRLEYGISLIIYYAIYFLTAMLMVAMGESGVFLMIAVMVPMIWFLTAQAAKRCHDLGRSGWFQLIPFYNPFALLFAEGDAARNEYGANPKSPNQAEDILESETLDGHMREQR